MRGHEEADAGWIWGFGDVCMFCCWILLFGLRRSEDKERTHVRTVPEQREREEEADAGLGQAGLLQIQHQHDRQQAEGEHAKRARREEEAAVAGQELEGLPPQQVGAERRGRGLLLLLLGLVGAGGLVG